jgi:hypothetical protein
MWSRCSAQVAATILALYWTMKKLINMMFFRGRRKESVVAPVSDGTIPEVHWQLSK